MPAQHSLLLHHRTTTPRGALSWVSTPSCCRLDDEESQPPAEAAVAAALGVLSRGGGAGAAAGAADAAAAAAEQRQLGGDLPQELDEFGRDLNAERRREAAERWVGGKEGLVGRRVREPGRGFGGREDDGARAIQEAMFWG